jgi:DNA-binding NarL/FixJ family response regulator
MTESASPAPRAPDATPPVADAKSRVFIVDDHTMFREGMKQLIDREADLTVCGDAASGDEALGSIPGLKPDLVIVDLSLSGSTGLDLIKTLRSLYPALPVLVVSMHEETLYAERALHAGASGYVMKQEPAKTVKLAIRKVLAGDLHLSEKMTMAVLGKAVRRGQSGAPESPMEKLSDRELEVFRLLGEGKMTRQIAEELNVSIATINSFRNRIKEKLEFKNSAEMILHAIQWTREGSAPGRTG